MLDFVEVKKKLKQKSHGRQIQLSYQKNTPWFHVQQETAVGFRWAARLDLKAQVLRMPATLVATRISWK